ncbi:T9SS type A sorting domain-containing protein [Flavivirga amylovorans]|uniref:T9SS type A sorting domain-containing protein n=1 Tax=Flavivirga amylovorans TaxID=870486 RepID=A0ABT8X3I5_9FLAO|nr:T9SS type A sorting domain-containing protein [Flavivirga amylovorans]MDO5988526.1 T9SS type A sorting domain-containing protein [Flavivirga amylovorans]
MKHLLLFTFIILPFAFLQGQPAYSDANGTIAILIGSGDGWTFNGAWGGASQTWLNSGQVMNPPSDTAWAERDLSDFAGTSKYVYVMWHKNGGFRADAARYRVYDGSGDIYSGTANQWAHADGISRQDDTFSGWLLLDNKKINITASTKLRVSQDAPVIGGQEFMQNDAILLSDFPIIDNTSLGATSNFEVFPSLSGDSDGEQGVGHHWGMQGLGYQYTVTNGNSFTTTLSPSVFTDLLEEDYVVQVSWDYLNTDDINVTNAKYSVNSVETSDTVNQNREASNQGGSFVSGNSYGSWSGFYSLAGQHAHTTVSPVNVSSTYNSALQGTKRLLYDMIRFVPVSQLGTLSTDNFNFEKKGDVGLRNYPNPFNNETTFSYSLPNSGKVSIRIYNSIGVSVSEILNETQAKGSHTINYKNQNLVTGVYYCVLKFNGKATTNKLIVN